MLPKKSNLLFAFLILFFLFIVLPFAHAQYTKLLDFSGAANGSNPYGSLISDGTFLYGMTYYGGSNDMGVIFKIMPDGTGYSKLLDFGGTLNGSNPMGSLFSDSAFLYGMTQYGGANNSGIIFKIKPDGSSFSKMFVFSGVVNGSQPQGSFISDGTFLYGMTLSGGSNNMGVIFKIKPDGTTYSKLLDFAGATNGAAPYGTLVFDGTFLYGMTQSGGANNLGVIFKIHTDGTGYSKLLDLSTINGSNPYGSLIIDGSFLYGMTHDGGANNHGVIFKINTNGSGYSILHDFTNATDGWFPESSLISDGTFLYGTTYSGGTNTDGIIFRINLNGSGYNKLLDFSGVANGSSPYGSLIIEGNSLYGMTLSGGTNHDGVLYKVDIATNDIPENISTTHFNVYPNPTSKSITVSSSEKINTVEIYNLLGERIYMASNFINQTPIEIGISDFPKGIYLAKIYTGEKIYTEKFVKQ